MTKKANSERKEVAGPDIGGVVAQERRPGLPGTPRRLGIAHVLLHGPFADADVQLQQLALDALRAPEDVFCGHLPDQRDRLGRHLWPTRR